MKREYGSDLMVDLLKELNIEYIAFNPGSSFRGLHESIVNFGGNKDPEVILCCHEGVSVSLAQGYAKVAGRPMAVATHNVVGLLHATNSIYIDFMDQTPVLILGGTGPMAIEKRRPNIDWIHTAQVQGTVVRDYVKWDDQPYSIDSLAESFYRGYRTAVAEPKGPVYVCLDATLQEQKLPAEYNFPKFTDYPVSSSPQADPAALRKVARMLVQAKHPILMADYLGKNQSSVGRLVELAELLAAPVIDAGSRFNFPSTHPLDATEPECPLLKEADVVVGFDMRDFNRDLNASDYTTRQARCLAAENAKIVHIGLQEQMIRSWSQHIGRLQRLDMSITGDTALVMPLLIAMCREEIEKGDQIDRNARMALLSARHDNLRKQWRQKAESVRTQKPIALAHLAAETWEVIKNEDWVLVNRTLDWTRRLWDWNKPYQWVGENSGGYPGYGVGHSTGAALAHRGKGRICIGFQPDGDMLYLPSALWTAAKHRVPLLVIMHNNRSYYNSENHQRLVSQARGRDITTRGVGTVIDDPPVDFAAMARSFGLYGEGPISEPEQVRPAIERAVRHIKEKGACALVDVITEPK